MLGMKEKINSYFAVLLITIAGAGATLLIVHIANTGDSYMASVGNNSATASLQKSILNTNAAGVPNH